MKREERGERERARARLRDRVREQGQWKMIDRERDTGREQGRGRRLKYANAPPRHAWRPPPNPMKEYRGRF
eukprot:1087690-Amorphochlora_amoeboformis.AAC.1